MKTEKIDVKNKSLLIVGPLYDKLEKLYSISPLFDETKIVVFLGDICYPYERYSEIIPRIEDIKQFMTGKDCHYILGDKDLIFAQKVFSAHADAYDWIKEQKTAMRFVFDNNTSVLVLHGGVLPKHTTWSELNNDLEIVFIEKIPEINKPWHASYNGRFGYCISSHPANDKNDVKIFKNSISLDTSAYKTNKVAVQEFTKTGLGKTIYI